MAMLSGGGAEQSEEAAQERAKELEVRYEMQMKQMLESVEVAFDLYEKESGTRLSRPKLQIQDQLKMVIAVGTEESVAIAAEIIEASMGTGASNPPHGRRDGNGRHGKHEWWHGRRHDDDGGRKWVWLDDVRGGLTSCRPESAGSQNQ